MSIVSLVPKEKSVTKNHEKKKKKKKKLLNFD